MVVAPLLWDSFVHKNPTGPAYFAPQTSTRHPTIYCIQHLNTEVPRIRSQAGQFRLGSSITQAAVKPFGKATRIVSAGTSSRHGIRNAPRWRSRTFNYSRVPEADEHLPEQSLLRHPPRENGTQRAPSGSSVQPGSASDRRTEGC